MNETLLSRPRAALALVAVLALPACTVVGPKYEPPALATVAITAPAWDAPLPHAGEVGALSDWWARWNDTALNALIAAAQAHNSTLTQAQARIEQARAASKIAGASELPGVNAGANLSRGNQGSGSATSLDGSIQAGWEIDLFGGNARNHEAARARLEARQLDWHDARVSVAADVATLYINLRANQLLLAGFDADAASRAETARLTTLKTNAGFEAPANAALVQASAADARTRVQTQKLEIELGIKALTFLTGLSATETRKIVFEIPAAQILVPGFRLESVPAKALAQRPDLAAIERGLAAASAEIGAAEADRYPKISLAGSIGYSILRFRGETSSGGVPWSLGPISVTVPLFDAGRGLAAADLARARYAESFAAYKLSAARAVREVEEQLARLQSTQAREANIAETLTGYLAFERAAQARLSVGLGSLLELEEARRAVLGARISALNLQRERALAWISLYRAVGGGWDGTMDVAVQTQTETTPK